jgi:predicted nucleic acid-binding protein
MLVVDAGAALELLLRRPIAAALEQHVVDHGFDLHAPPLLDVEVLSALRRLVASRDASPARADEAVTDLLDMPIERYPHDLLIRRAWQLRENVSAYDAVYLALAEALSESGAQLLTTDARLARAARAHTGVEVILAG